MTADRAWVNGRLLPAEEATVSIFDHGLTVGDGVFETLKARDGVPFGCRRHLARLRLSAKALGLRLEVTDQELREAMTSVLGLHPAPSARVRITVTGGPSPLGSERADGPATVIVAAGPITPAPVSTAACTVPWTRNERGAVAGIKTTSYAENVRALAYARERGCSEALFASTTGLLCEGTGSNVFVVHGDRVVTPPLSSGCLAGITRELVLEITTAEEEHVAMFELATADEVFLTSSGRDVQSVRYLDGRDLGEPGRHTVSAARSFAALAAENSDP